MGDSQPYVTIRSRKPAGSMSSSDSTYGSSAGDDRTPAATHDTSRVNYHVKHISDFARTLEGSAARAFPNRGRSQRYKKVQALLLHWKSDDLFVLPELEDLEQCLRDDYSFATDTFSIPSDNSHLELMMKVGQMIKEHESTDTLFIVYYGGHARIDESRQSTWCANRSPDSPWLQWSAIQTLVERSLSDVLILLDCCAGAASATFPNGASTTETISASSWDAIAPDPGRYSFTSALIEVLVEWKNRTYSAAMLHAEILARLKHPRPIMHNGRRGFEARSTPVHFMMTSNHRAPSIEMVRVFSPEKTPPSPPAEPKQEMEQEPDSETMTGRSGVPQDVVISEPNEDVPHVMISLALEEDQTLDVNAWESWLAAFPAIAKYVKVQGVFKSHSTLMLLSLPVMVWDLLPNDLACNFIGFIRSNNLAIKSTRPVPTQYITVPTGSEEEARSILSETTASMLTDSIFTGDNSSDAATSIFSKTSYHPESVVGNSRATTGSLAGIGRRKTAPASDFTTSTTSNNISNQMILNQARNSKRNVLVHDESAPNRPDLAQHVQTRLEAYFQDNPAPTVAITEFLASNLGVETTDIDLWFAHRREQQQVEEKFRDLQRTDQRPELAGQGARMILPGHLNHLLEIIPLDEILLVDLRSPSDYERSHVYGAINLRAPASFVRRASLEMVEKTLADGQSREIFKKWATSRCIVFYDRQIEYTWECPTGEALIQKFRSMGWKGQGFILKGHYREFSASFDKYIGGQRMTTSAKNHLEGIEEKTLQKKTDGPQKYDEWLLSLANEELVSPTELVPAVKTQRTGAAVRHQKDLEDELERQMPSLYRKALELKPDDNWDIKAPIVEHLSRGIEKMQHSGRGGGSSSQPDYSDKLRQDKHGSERRNMADSDDESRARDSAPQKAGVRSPPEEVSGQSDDSRRVRGRNVWKMLRSGR